MRSQGLASNKNQVPPGYKQTEVGVIPEDWEVDKFINITEVITCGVAATPKYVTETTGKPFLSAQNVQNGRVIYENYKFISKELFAQITKHNKPTKGDILYTRVGAGIGEAGVIEDNFEFAIYVSLTLIKPKYQKIDSYWIAYVLNSERYKFKAKNGLFAGAGVQNLNVEVVRNFAIPLPPLPEQKAIAQTLSDVDALIAALDKLIAKKRNIKTATMQQLLTGKTRLPGFGEGKGYKKSASGLIPEDWEVMKLGDILKICHGKSQHHIINNSGIYPILATGGEIGKTNIFLYNKPSVLIGRKGTIDAPMYIETPFWTIDTLFYSEISSNANAKFIFYKFKLIDWYSYNEASGVPSLNAATIERINQSFPKLEEQKAIASVLSDIDQEIAALEKRRAKTQAIKQGMMQELLTGKTRIIDN